MPAETLLSESTILLFGRTISDLTLNAAAHKNSTGAVAPVLQNANAQIARIYSFSYLNEFFDLEAPALFVVNGKGTTVAGSMQDSMLSKIKGGIASDLMYWAVDREDMSVRLDVMTGRFSRILLDEELAEDGLQDFVRGTSGLGVPSELGGNSRRRRGRRWRSDED